MKSLGVVTGKDPVRLEDDYSNLDKVSRFDFLLSNLKNKFSTYKEPKKVVYAAKRTDGMIKIGISSKPNIRKKAVENQGGLKIVAWFESKPIEKSDAFSVETKIHKEFSLNRKTGEWFKCDFKRITGVISKEVDDLFLITPKQEIELHLLTKRLCNLRSKIKCKNNYCQSYQKTGDWVLVKLGIDIYGFCGIKRSQVAQALTILKNEICLAIRVLRTEIAREEASVGQVNLLRPQDF